MARKPRFMLPGYPQHVIIRGNDRHACFFAPPDYRLFLELLSEAIDRYAVDMHAYVLMTNHVHLLVTPSEPFGISHAVQRTSQRYVQRVNRQYRRTGTLWEGRFKSSLVESDRYLLACMRYIELNPVRAGMVANPGEYIWSSYLANAWGKAHDLLTPHPVFGALGKSPASRQRAYQRLFETPVEIGELGMIRGTLNKELVLGSLRFRDKIEAMTERQAGERPRGRPKKLNCVGVY